jgi:hypothetical protein
MIPEGPGALGSLHRRCVKGPVTGMIREPSPSTAVWSSEPAHIFTAHESRVHYMHMHCTETTTSECQGGQCQK